MKALKELKTKSAGELENVRVAALVAHKNFRFAIAGSKTKNVREGRNLRRNVARINTLLKTRSEAKQ